ncbi:TolC family protein, partial [Tenacibaculum finnmarkense]|nr:TolC family protein [Tenacibaculum finnmarkense]
MRKYIYTVFICFCTSFLFAQKQLNLSMQEAIDYAIKNSYANKIAKNDIKVAIKRKWETTTIGLPKIDGKVAYQNNLKQAVLLTDFNNDGIDEELIFGKKQTMNATATLSQLIFDGSYLVGLQAAKTYLKISEQAKQKTALATREAIINAYGNILVSERLIEILEKNT